MKKLSVDDLARMVEGYAEWDRCIVLFPSGDQTGCRWIGMSKGDCAATLHKCAAELITKHMPPAQGTH